MHQIIKAIYHIQANNHVLKLDVKSNQRQYIKEPTHQLYSPIQKHPNSLCKSSMHLKQDIHTHTHPNDKPKQRND